MATISDYKSGKAAKSVRLAYDTMENLDRPLMESEIAPIFQQHINELVPLMVREPQAIEYIQQADRCAIGERLCKCEFPEAPSTCAVFLDELADAMVSAGKAAYSSTKEAMEALSNHRGKPLVVSKVSGKYMEICRTFPQNCFYWNMEKNGMKCLQRVQKT